MVDKGWTEAIEIEVGDKVLLHNGTTAIVENKTVEQLNTPVKAYNLTVNGFHTYFVGKNCVLVHNADYIDPRDFDDFDYQNRKPVGKQNGNTPRNNQKQNEQTNYIRKKLRLRGDERKQLHDLISHEGFDFKEVLDEAKNFFNEKR